MDDVTNRSLTSHPPWTMTSPFNATTLATNSSFDVTTFMTSLVEVTECVFNATVNETVCDVVGADTTTVSLVPPPKHSLWLTIFLGVLAGVVSIVTVLGNFIVILAFGLERSIRQPTNYFLASLAVSDLLIGTFSMPLFTQYLLLDYWVLGPWLCDLWLSLDWTVCLTSQYTVFFITMDRFLSVKIPAKYRNWRTERKVLVMVAVSWILPAVVFFTSIIGWQFFTGERTVGDLACEVQFMQDPLFTFMLTIGYYWITLIVMCVLYAGIYKVALDLQRKSDAKQRKLESTMELAADHSRNTGSNSTDSDRGRGPAAYFKKRKKKSLKSNEADNSGAQSADLNSLNQNKGLGPGQVNTTSFSGRNKLRAGSTRARQDSLGGGSVATDMDNKDEDRSSSPAFASDDEGSSSSHTPNNSSKSPKGNHNAGGGSSSGGGGGFGSSNKMNNNRRSTKSSLNPKAGIAGIVNTAMLTTPDTFRASLDIGRPSQMLAITAPPQHQAIAAPTASSPPNSAKRSPSPSRVVTGNGKTPTRGGSIKDKAQEELGTNGTPMPPSGQQCLRMGGPSYSRLESLADEHKEQADGVYSSSTERPNAPLLETALRGCPYIDEKSFLQVTGGTPMANINGGGGGGGGVVVVGGNGGVTERESPLWKRRNSLPLPPLAGDIFDIVIDDDFPSYGITEVTTLNATSKQNGGNDVALGDDEDGDNSEMGEGDDSAVPLNRPHDPDEAGDTDSQRLSEPRRGGGRGVKGSDGRLHSFVKSVRSRNSRRRNRRERKSKSENRARKALRTITIILGAFVLCWTPYHIMLFIIAVCDKNYECINMGFYNFTYWLCYLNSPINPFCYAFANAQFKRTFLRILRLDWHRT